MNVNGRGCGNSRWERAPIREVEMKRPTLPYPNLPSVNAPLTRHLRFVGPRYSWLNWNKVAYTISNLVKHEQDGSFCKSRPSLPNQVGSWTVLSVRTYGAWWWAWQRDFLLFLLIVLLTWDVQSSLKSFMMLTMLNVDYGQNSPRCVVLNLPTVTS